MVMPLTAFLNGREIKMRAYGAVRIAGGKTLEAGSLFSGLIDDVRIYNVALSAKEIEEMAR